VFFHVFAQTTHIVAALHGFARAGIPATRLYIPSVIEIRSGVSEPQGVKIWPFPLLWLFAFTTANVQAVTSAFQQQRVCTYSQLSARELYFNACYLKRQLLFCILYSQQLYEWEDIMVSVCSCTEAPEDTRERVGKSNSGPRLRGEWGTGKCPPPAGNCVGKKSICYLKWGVLVQSECY